MEVGDMQVGDTVYVGERVRGRIRSARAVLVERVTARHVTAGGFRFWKESRRAVMGFKQIWPQDSETRSFISWFTKQPLG